MRGQQADFHELPDRVCIGLGLKPRHALWIETLQRVYPDARLVWAHRDPFTATSSFCSIISMGHMGYAGTIDHQWIGENCAYQAQLHLDRAMDSRARLGHDRIVDFHYADIIRDPLGAIRQLYADLGDDFSAEAEAAMQAWLDDNPQGKFGKHEYALAQYGLSVDALTPRFERYLSAYEVVREG